MIVTESQLRRIVKRMILSEKKDDIKNPGPYIDGERTEAGVDDDGDGVPNKADPKPKDGAVTEGGCGGDLMPVSQVPHDLDLMEDLEDIPDIESYEAAMQFMEDNSGMLTSTIDSLMSLTGATCKRSFLMAVVDYFSDMIDQPSGDLGKITMSLGGIGF